MFNIIVKVHPDNKVFVVKHQNCCFLDTCSHNTIHQCLVSLLVTCFLDSRSMTSKISAVTCRDLACLSALLILGLVDRRDIDPDDPLAKEFGVHALAG